MVGLRRIGVVLAVVTVCLVAGTGPVSANEVTVGNAAARSSTDGMGGQGTDPGEITVTTGDDPLGVGPFHISIDCDNGFSNDLLLAANTTVVAYSTTPADGVTAVICSVTQADTVVYESYGGDQSDACLRPPTEPCESSNTHVTFTNQIPKVASIAIDKQTNGVDAATPDDAAAVVAGDAVTWTYEITNDGTIPVVGETVTVVDDHEGEVTCDVPDQLMPGESVTCEPIVGTATEGPYANTATATATATECFVCGSFEVTASDTSHYQAAPAPSTTTTTTAPAPPAVLPAAVPPAARPVSGQPTYTG
ncbi:MAG: hypothetical protein JWO77_973 [Ilumatobacteraceae bacterium]|nr:hypothetical protein [Ilumatobacteraceae bacterium]